MPGIANSILIKEKALSLGFSACGITPPGKLHEEVFRLDDYLKNNYHGEMGYMANHVEKRLDPRLLVPEVKSIVVVLLNYFPNEIQFEPGVPIVSKYAYGKDYHLVIKDKMKQLFDYINTEIAPIKGRIFSDSAPILERAWAVQAGLGWIGKNGLLLNKKLGSFFFIGELLIDLELSYDEPYTKEHCGICTNCIQSCPTKALVSPYILDARKCISYLTIELKGDIPDLYKPHLMNRVFGCDICQDYCPWNQKLKPHTIDQFQPTPEFIQLNKSAWDVMDKNQFDKLFSNSPVQRAGYEKLKKNIGNIINS